MEGINIIQTWKSLELPQQLYDLVQKMQSHNPNAKHLLFTDNNIVAFIQTFFPKYYDVFAQMKYKIQQIDFFRYLAIYYYGGLYLDMDMDIHQSFDTLDREKCIFPVEIGGSDDMLIGNYAFYAPARHPFLRHIINCIVDSAIDESEIHEAQKTHTDPKEHVYVYYTTGPELVTHAYKTYENKEDIILLKPSGEFRKDCFGDYGEHRSFGTWKTMIPDTEVLV
jgi:inositol phosphorylceramide mannosyltransferase catalytic subunit